jgi:hypothetical protein
VQRIGASYIAKKFADQIMAPPPRPAEVEDQEEAAPGAPDLTGQIITDENGQAIGRAYRLPEVAVYVIAERGADLEAELARTLAEPEKRLFFQSEGERITGLIYAPDPARVANAAPGVRGIRADDV